MSSPPTITVTCSCGRTFLAPDSAAGKRARCPSCDKGVLVPVPSLETSEVDHLSTTQLRMIARLPFPPSEARPETANAPAVDTTPASSPPPEWGLREYKVLGRSDEGHDAGSFQPQDLEAELNTHAAQGWRLHSIVAIRVPGTAADQVIAILERPA
ncbi:DUF4177 domain-containing protein [Tautonia sociabilis]|uniref:DUF4177 domain-containing protein n=1 Tax=Tautonia sociabilis TaxID=2080755 RepID=A0A432MJT4_9BACT|nr:DUF4177 domain-containing protein [Tautonia sociabilis]RUL87388.1 DUF4177 domain-containing protein [Tautonia sociabilis]